MQPRGKQSDIVIRKKGSAHGTILRFIVLAALWLFVIFVVTVNICFIFHVYSDSLVSFYLLLNLNRHLYSQLVLGILGVALVIAVYAGLRLRSLGGHS